MIGHDPRLSPKGMRMKKVMILSVCMALLAAGGPAWAVDYAGAIVAELQQQGYGRIETEVTWLGRVRIVAERKGGSREIILNPRTGEILRDLWLLADGGSGESRIIGDDDYGDDDSSNSGSGSSGSDDSGTSGSGSDSSGSGGSGSDDSGSSGSGSDDSSSSGSGSGHD